MAPSEEELQAAQAELEACRAALQDEEARAQRLQDQVELLDETLAKTEAARVAQVAETARVVPPTGEASTAPRAGLHGHGPALAAAGV